MASTRALNLSSTSRSSDFCQYQPLDPKNNEIRLLQIHPAQQAVRYGDPIECNLVITSLSAPPTYQALSYAWGTQPAVEEISLDGQRSKVTPNLEDALLQLTIDATDLIWIDAICLYFDRYRTDYHRNLKFRLLFSKAVHFASQINTSVLVLLRISLFANSTPPPTPSRREPTSKEVVC